MLQDGLGRAHALSTQRRDDVERERLQLQPHVERHQVGGRYHHHHTDGGERNQKRVLEAQKIALLHVPFRHHENGTGGQQDRHLGKARKGILDQQAAEGYVCTLPVHGDPGAQTDH